MQEFFIPGTTHTRPQDITNVGMGVGSKYVSDDEAGVPKNKEIVKTADFGVDTQEEKEESEKLKRLRRLKAFRNLQRRNYV